mmetsp:Transcript_29044/g.81253  ORF Transcript_29044/g.81253 Transcript_29044/m.81253 type:complete len:208 (-) Transcript_29044:497-1120(-)
MNELIPKSLVSRRERSQPIPFTVVTGSNRPVLSTCVTSISECMLCSTRAPLFSAATAQRRRCSVSSVIRSVLFNTTTSANSTCSIMRSTISFGCSCLGGPLLSASVTIAGAEPTTALPSPSSTANWFPDRSRTSKKDAESTTVTSVSRRASPVSDGSSNANGTAAGAAVVSPLVKSASSPSASDARAIRNDAATCRGSAIPVHSITI